MDEISGLRLLPWTTSDGRPAYTPDNNPHGLLARLADETEHAQMERAADVPAKITKVLELSRGTRLVNEPSRVLLTAACTSLTDVMRVSASRGMRLPPIDEDDEPVND